MTDMIVFLVGNIMTIGLGIAGNTVKGRGGSGIALLSLFGIIFGMIFTGGILNGGDFTLLGYDLGPPSPLEFLPLFFTVIDIILFIDALR